jgi:hypothetical protein
MDDRIDRAVDINRYAHIAFGKSKQRVINQVLDVLQAAGHKVVQANDRIASSNENITQVRT